MLYAIVALLVLVLDQAVKYWATIGIAFNDGSVTLIPGVISLVNIHNYGAAFGFLQNQNARWLFVLVAIIFVAIVIFALGKNYIREPLGRWSAVLVMAGAVGNCIDRVMNGYVVDMFQFQFVNFAVFNVADIFITVCGILFCVYIIFSDEFKGKGREPSRQRSPAEAKKAPQPITAAPEASAARETDVRAYVPKTQRPAKERPRPEATRSVKERPRPEATRSVKERPRPEATRSVKERPRPEAAAASVFHTTAVKADPDPFAEWESLPPLDARPDRAADAVVASSVVSEETVSKAPPKAKPKKPDTEFTLEDILAEFSSK